MTRTLIWYMINVQNNYKRNIVNKSKHRKNYNL